MNVGFEGLLERYIRYLEEEGIDKERYKWEAIYHFQSEFDLDAEDFALSLRQATSKAGNLVYLNSLGFIRKAVDYFPEEVRGMFKELYDESKPLKPRFNDFVEASEKLLPKVIEKFGKKLNHQQDERTISYYLTMRYPETYPLYKNETYQYLLSVLGDQSSKPAGEKLFHYLELADTLIEAVESDGDVIDMVEDQLTEECYRGEQKWMVFQDVLWINMRAISTTSYWLFQGNPKVFDLEAALKEEKLRSWRVTAHKSKITPGDKVILWASGDKRGCYALAEVESEVYEDGVNEEEVPYYNESVEDDTFDQVQLRITHNLSSNPITEERIKGEEKLSELNVGHQGTNFTSTEEEFNVLLDMAESIDADSKWKRLQNTVKKIDNEPAVRSFFYSVRYLIHELGMDENHPKLYAASVDYYLHLTVGGKYLTFIQFKNDKVELAYHVERSMLDKLKEDYPDLEYSDGYKDDNSDTIFIKIDPNEHPTEELLRATARVGIALSEKYSKSNYRSIYPDVLNPWIIRVANNDDLLERLLNNEGPGNMKTDDQNKSIKYPLNTIFYGPPGTGKTYSTIKRAAEIVEGRKIKNYVEAKEIFNDQLGDTIEFITFHQNYSYEDFIQGLRPDIENSQQLTFDRADGIFKKLADKALKNWKASRSPQTKKQSFEQVFNEYIQPLIEGEVEELEVEMKRVSYYITAVTDKSIEFRKSSGGTSHTLSINTLRKMYEAESVLEIQGLSSYYSPLLDKLLDIGKSPGETEQVDLKNYVIIIDEINRANISRVFGELITLIEPDKRYGSELHIPAKLPSGESFSVPKNLYIIGTMNTADKSIALLDIALRRRFDFEAMYPKYNIKDQQIHDVDVLKKINERIIKLKGHDFQIGHSYFMEKKLTLKQRMNRKVIPLLLEYFMNDEKEVKDILSHAGLEVEDNSWPLRITGKK